MYLLKEDLFGIPQFLTAKITISNQKVAKPSSTASELRRLPFGSVYVELAK